MRLQVGDVRLFFDTEGSVLVPAGATMAVRPVLVLLHGGPGADHSLFRPEFSAMTDSAQLVYLDQRGSGRSERGDPAKWTWRQWADDVAEFCRQLGISRPILVGASSGGLVAMHCAIRHPGLVAGLVLDSPLGVPTTLDETVSVFGQRGGPAAAGAALRYLSGEMSPQVERDWAELCMPLYGSGTEGDRDLAERLSRCLLNDDVQRHFRQGGCGPTELTAAELQAITCPTLVLAGQDDPVSPAAAAQRLTAAIRHARIRVFPGVGHGVCRQAPYQAFANLRPFLDVCAMPRAGQVASLVDTVDTADLI